MRYILDTNVLSELNKAKPDRGVVEWITEADEDEIYLSVITVAEIRNGIERLSDGNRRRLLEAWLNIELPIRFENRILPIEYEVANEWGIVVAQRQSQGRPIGVMDGFIAATARVHDLALVTRNTPDFSGSLRDIVNPWIGE